MSTRCQLRCFDDPRCCYDEPVVTVVTDASNEERLERQRTSKKVPARRWNVGSSDDLPEDPEREQQVDSCDIPQVDSCGSITTSTPNGPAAQLIELLNLPGQKATVFSQDGSLVLKLGSSPQRSSSMTGLEAWGGNPILESCDPWELEEDNFRGFEEVGTLEGGVRELLSLPSRDSESSMWLSLPQGSTDCQKMSFSLGQHDFKSTTEEEVHSEAREDHSSPCIDQQTSPLKGNEGGKDAQPAGKTGVNLGEQLRKDPSFEPVSSLEETVQKENLCHHYEPLLKP